MELSDNTGLDLPKTQLASTSTETVKKSSKVKYLLIALGLGLVVVVLLGIIFIVFTNTRNNPENTQNNPASLPTENKEAEKIPEKISALKNKICFKYGKGYWCSDRDGQNPKQVKDVGTDFESIKDTSWVEEKLLYTSDKDNRKIFALDIDTGETTTIFEADSTIFDYSCNKLDSCIATIGTTPDYPVDYKVIIWKKGEKDIDLKYTLERPARGGGPADVSTVRINSNATKFLFSTNVFAPMTNAPDCKSDNMDALLIVSDFTGKSKIVTNCATSAFWKDDFNIYYQDSASKKLISYNTETEESTEVASMPRTMFTPFLDKVQVVNANVDNSVFYYIAEDKQYNYTLFSYELASNKETAITQNAYPIGLTANNELLIGQYRNCVDPDKCMLLMASTEVYGYKIYKNGKLTDTSFLDSLPKLTMDQDGMYVGTPCIMDILSSYQPLDMYRRIAPFLGD